MVDGRRLDDMSADIDEAAARWHLAQADDDMDWAAFTDWLEADPRHRDAYDAMALLDDRIDAAGPALHTRAADPLPERRIARWGPWSAIAAVVIAAVTSQRQNLRPIVRTFAASGLRLPSSAAMRPTTSPQPIIVARSTPSSSATNSGPGVGGTSECVIVAPATIASTQSR